MSEPAKIGTMPQLGEPRRWRCGRVNPMGETLCESECETYVVGGVTYRTARCKLHGELEYSAQWQKRAASAKDDAGAMQRLLDERARWIAAGHTYRGTADRTFIDRRAGADT